MPAAVAAPIIGSGISAIGGMFGAHEAASANKEATQTEKQLSEEALAYQKEQDAYRRRTEANRYGTMMAGLSPYASAGSHANTVLSGFLGLPTPDTSSTPSPMTSNLVTLQAPDGSTKQVPASEMQHWIDKGATLTGATGAQAPAGAVAGAKPRTYSPSDVLAQVQRVHFQPGM